METKPPVDDYVLYADDDPDDQMILSESFAQYAQDKKLETVSSGDELLAYLGANIRSKGRPCLIILDQNMPGSTGDQVLQILKTNEWYRDIPVVMFSTSTVMHIDLLKQYDVSMEIKPAKYSEWQKLAVTLLGHCDRFRREAV